MPYKDKEARYAAIRRAVAKKPDLYKALGLNNKRKQCLRGYHIERRYGITMAQYEEMLAAQNGGCAICSRPSGFTKSGRHSLQVDHNHTTGKVRGLLCSRCNSFVAWIEHNPAIVAGSEAYLAKDS